MTKVVNIIQARMASVRFPGKMVADLHGYPAVDWVLKRCLKAKTVDETFLATSDTSQDDILAERAEHLNVPVFRGSKDNVLSRFAEVTKQTGADVIVRVCADRPLIDPALVDMAVNFFIEYDDIDLAYNHISGDGQNWPRGFGVEVLWAKDLLYMHETQHEGYYQEHVTPYMWQNLDKYNIKAIPCIKELDVGIPDIKCDLDTRDDFELIQSISEGLSIDSTAVDFFNAWKRVTNFNG